MKKILLTTLLLAAAHHSIAQLNLLGDPSLDVSFGNPVQAMAVNQSAEVDIVGGRNISALPTADSYQQIRAAVKVLKSDGNRILLGAEVGQRKIGTTGFGQRHVMFSISDDLRVGRASILSVAIGARLRRHSIDPEQLSWDNQFGSNGYDPTIDSQEDLMLIQEVQVDYSAGLGFTYLLGRDTRGQADRDFVRFNVFSNGLTQQLASGNESQEQTQALRVFADSKLSLTERFFCSPQVLVSSSLMRSFIGFGSYVGMSRDPIKEGSLGKRKKESIEAGLFVRPRIGTSMTLRYKMSHYSLGCNYLFYSAHSRLLQAMSSSVSVFLSIQM